MINHVRTFLLNRPARQTASVSLGYEYVPPTFMPVQLPSQLLPLVSCLFGSRPDMVGMNFRLRQFMALLHAPEIVQYTLMDDSRFTYDLNDQRFFEESFAPRLVNINTAASAGFTIPPGALITDSGKLEYRCTCVASLDPLGDVGDPANVLSVPTTWDNELSAPILLPNSNGVQIQLTGPGMNPGDSFTVVLYRQYKTQLADLIEQLEHIFTDVLGYHLFGVGTPDRFAQFSAWWHESNQIHFRLGGVLLALARRTELLQQGVS